VRRTWQCRILILCILFLAVLAAPFSKSSAQPQDDAVARQFIGTWRLASWPMRLDDGRSAQDQRSVAYLIYTESGRMCFMGMNPNRPKWKSAQQPTQEELASATQYSNFGAYCGTFEIHAKEGYVLHHVEIEESPNLVGMTRKRWFTFEGPNRLSLKIDSSQLPAHVVEDTLIWERVH
jgi:hypothetical protein